jgi:ribonuclease HII
MPYLLGTDEAGYGPNLGPLVISASVWEVPDGVQGDDLYQRLQSVIAPRTKGVRTILSRGSRTRIAQNSSDPFLPLAIGDSKALYQPGGGLALLERGLWAVWGLLGRRPAVCCDVWTLLAGPNGGSRREALCAGRDEMPVPCDFDPSEIDPLCMRLGAALAEAGVRPVDLRSVAIFPREFNETTARCDSKGTALSTWTLRLVAELIERLPEDRIFVLCDKHGGRDHYLPLLTDRFPGPFIEVVCEGRAKSVYRFEFEGNTRRVEISFQAKGESHLPTALASMASKYLREMAMRAFNEHWARHVPDLRPTAGYPGDARRFKSDIAAAQRELGIDDTILWRVK